MAAISATPTPTVTTAQSFQKILRKRVNSYLKENNIDRHGDASMKFKTIAMVAIYFVPYLLIATQVISGWWALIPFAVMGAGLAGIGTSVMHDANHGAYSRNRSFNDWVGRIVNLVGGFDTNWKIQHNVLHHTYTNVSGVDEDIDPGALMRFSPHAPVKKFHRFQHIYAWFFYGLMTLAWVTTKDFRQLHRYKEMDLMKTQNTTYARELRRLLLYKIFYYVYVVGIPIALGVPVPVMIVGFLMMHFIAGFLLGIIFQPAHVMETSDYKEGNLENPPVHEDWAIHQLRTTTNFAPDNKLLSWYVGGLNYQIEHHLFPNICHVHYPKISGIVKETAEEFGVPYNVQPTFIRAIIEHGKMLKKLGEGATA